MAASVQTDAPGWDETCDVLVIGSGFAGIAAAIAAREAGASVLVLEKMERFGGNSAIDSGEIAVVGSPQQQARGIRDSARLLSDDLLANGGYLNDRAKVKYLCEHSRGVYDWLTGLGVQWGPGLACAGGHSLPRIIFTRSCSGQDIHGPMLRRCLALGAELRNRCYVERIIRGEKGERRALGVVAREGYRFPDAASGAPRRIRAKKGIILAYGGFAADVNYRLRYDRRLTADIQTTNQPGATGELWRESERIGCQILEASWIQSTPWNNPREPGQGIGWFFSEYGVEFSGFWINSEGRRFVDETANRKIRSEAIFEEFRCGRRVYSAASDACLEAMERLRPGYMDEVVRRGIVRRHDSLEALAGSLEIPVQALRETALAFNEAVAERYDTRFGRSLRWAVPVRSGRWYSAEMSPKVHHCMGGVITDGSARALDAKTQQPIPGLFAAGESRGGVFGACRLAACSIVDCILAGRLAGQTAAA